MKLEEFKNSWNLPEFKIQKVEHREGGSVWLYLYPEDSKRDSRLAICIPEYEAMRVCNESYTLLLNGQWLDEVPGKQIVRVSDSDWIKEIEQQSFEGSLMIKQQSAVHYIIADLEWVYEFISYDEPDLIELE